MSGADDDDLISPADAVRAFGIDHRQLDLWENTRRLPAVRTLRGRRYNRAQVAQLVEEHRRAAAALEEESVVPPEPAEAPAPETRTHARRRALEVLHAADVSGVAPEPSDDLPYYARALVEGVASHRDEIDTLIRARAEHWTIERMPVVDRCILRIGTFELRFTDVPTGVVINEAIALAKLLSTEDSGRFVNGLLGRVARDVRAPSS